MSIHNQANFPADFDLTQLGNVPLDLRHSRTLQLASSSCGGSPMWRNRKLAEARMACALAQISERVAILSLDLREDIRLHLLMRVPVACLPNPGGPLQIAPVAELGIVYPSNAVTEPQPGYSFVSLLNPMASYPNISSPATGQRICLGTTLVGIRLYEILFMVYRALTLQTVQFDALDSAGIMNPTAADWFQRHPEKIPLTTESFIRLDQPVEGRPGILPVPGTFSAAQEGS
jgi:hypothetical protein